MTLFLPPAPQTGAFFDTVRRRLSGVKTQAGTYPGYGDVPQTKASIEAYADSLLPLGEGTAIIGFHTGCLVALEMALQSPSLGPLILVDIPYFDKATIAKHLAGLDADNPNHDAFRAAFAYDLESTLSRTIHSVICVATDSSLFDATLKAVKKISGSTVIERRDITKPAFEGEDMAQLIRDILI